MYYMIGAKKETGCPVFINGVIHEAYSEGGADQPMLYSWYFMPPGQKLDPLPKELWLISKDTPYRFDLRTAFNGHIISETFLSVMKNFSLDGWEVSELHMVNQQGKPLSENRYYFARCNEAFWLKDAINIDESKIDFDKKGSIKKIWKLALSISLSPDIFLIDCIAALRVVFCSANFVRLANEEHLKGVEFIDLSEFGKATRA